MISNLTRSLVALVLVLPLYGGGWSAIATCDGCMVLPLRSRKRWRDAMFEGPSRRVSDGPSLRSQAATEPRGLAIAGAPADHPPSSLSRHLLLERRGTALAAETIRLPADHFGHGSTSRHEDPAHRVLHHLIPALRKTGRLPAAEFPEGAAQKIIEDDEEDENDDNSIHSRTTSVSPQSYGTVPVLSTFPQLIGSEKTNGLRRSP